MTDKNYNRVKEREREREGGEKKKKITSSGLIYLTSLFTNTIEKGSLFSSRSHKKRLKNHFVFYKRKEKRKNKNSVPERDSGYDLM